MKTTTDSPTDPLGSLGAPIRPQAPAPAPVQHSPGILRGADDRLETQLPLPARPRCLP